MIVYDRFWKLLKEKNISQYHLQTYHQIDRGQLRRMKENSVLKTTTLDKLCKALNCRVEDIMEYIPDSEGPCSRR